MSERKGEGERDRKRAPARETEIEGTRENACPRERERVDVYGGKRKRENAHEKCIERESEGEKEKERGRKRAREKGKKKEG